MFGIFGRRRSRDNVRERLKLVLSYDRAKLTPGKMEELKTELLGVIGKYFPSEEQEYDVRFEQQGERMVLVANLPMVAEAGAALPAAAASGAAGAERAEPAETGPKRDAQAAGSRKGTKGRSGKKKSSRRR